MLERDTNINIVGSWVGNDISEIALWQTLSAAFSLSPPTPSSRLAGEGFSLGADHSVLGEVDECRLIRTWYDSSLPLASGGCRREPVTLPG